MVYEIERKTQNIKEELNKDIENLRKRNQKEILEIKSPFSQKKPKNKINPSEFKGKIEIKVKKNRRNLSQTTQEL
jgi:hypothetical protein